MNPGWYEDPHAPGYLRYWDGVAWTEEQKPVPEVVTVPEPVVPPAPREAPRSTSASTERPSVASPRPSGVPTRGLSAPNRRTGRAPRATPEPEGAAATERSRRRWSVTFWLALVLGIAGVHRFYVGKIPFGILQLMLYLAASAASEGSSVDNVTADVLTFGVFAWWLWDILWVVLQRFTDGEGRRVRFGRAEG